MPSGYRTQTVRVAETVASNLRQRILRGEFKTNSMFPKQDELVAEFQVSYPSVREALRILETESLITVRRGNLGGAEVHSPDAWSAAYSIGLALQAERARIHDLGDALLQFEPACAGMCATRFDRGSSVLPHLRDNLESTAKVLDDESAFTRIAREFHDLVVTNCGNETTRLVVRSLVALWSAQEETWADSMVDRHAYFPIADRQAVLRTHTAIAKKIDAGDAAGAEQLSRTHLRSTQDIFLARFNDEIVDATSTRFRAGYRNTGSTA